MNSTASVSQRSWVQILYRPEFFSGLIFTTAQVVHITARVSDYHLISPHNITLESNIRVMRIKEKITN